MGKPGCHLRNKRIIGTSFNGRLVTNKGERKEEKEREKTIRRKDRSGPRALLLLQCHNDNGDAKSGDDDGGDVDGDADDSDIDENDGTMRMMVVVMMMIVNVLPRNNPQDIRVYIILDSADVNSAARAAGEPKFFLFLFRSAMVSRNSLR